MFGRKESSKNKCTVVLDQQMVFYLGLQPKTLNITSLALVEMLVTNQVDGTRFILAFEFRTLVRASRSQFASLSQRKYPFIKLKS